MSNAKDQDAAKFEQLTEDQFYERYTLVPNHLNTNRAWNGCPFETYGEELAFVRQQDPRTVWTFNDGDGDDDCLISGFHYVNRIGYLISTTPVPVGVDIEVQLEGCEEEFQS